MAAKAATAMTAIMTRATAAFDMADNPALLGCIELACSVVRKLINVAQKLNAVVVARQPHNLKNKFSPTVIDAYVLPTKLDRKRS